MTAIETRTGVEVEVDEEEKHIFMISGLCVTVTGKGGKSKVAE